MSDPRFYFLHKPVSAQAAARTAGAELVRGDPEHRLRDVAALSSAKAGDITFARDRAVLKGIDQLDAGLCFCRADLVDPLMALGVHTMAVCEHPDVAFARAALSLVTPRHDVRQSGAVAPDATIAPSVHIGFGCCIGAGVKIGEGTVIGNGVMIEAGCVIGSHCTIGAGALISFTIMGDRVDIRPGAVLGEAGLGVFVDGAGIRATTHFGRVNIADEVRIGANTCIDRAVFGQTTIGARCKIDNLVQIAHNVRLGTDCVLASFCGIAGSTVLGNGVMMGGRAGIIDHIRIENNVQIGAGAVVTKNIKAGEIWSGHPARPLRNYLKEQVALRGLVEKRGRRQDDDE